MAKTKKRKKGLPPGSIVFTGNRKVETTQLHYLKYDGQDIVEEDFMSDLIQEIPYSEVDQVDWYDIRGMHDISIIERLGKEFRIHPLILEDIPNTEQRPMYEEYDESAFLTLKAISFDPNKKKIGIEHVAIFFRKGLVISVQESDSDLFKAVRDRIKTQKARINQKGADYLTYALADLIVDEYFDVLDKIEEAIEHVEDRLMVEQANLNKSEIHMLKKELLVTRRSIYPLREAISRFSKSENPVIEPQTNAFIRDLYDHTIQVMDTVDTYRDIINGLQDLYISEVSLKMNQVMQVLTLVSTIFIPLTFLAGIYGMNFQHMPELQWRYSYYVLWAIMIVITIILILLFKRKKWL